MSKRCRQKKYIPDKVYDDDEVESGGSIGGDAEKAYDDPEHRSGGSIGGD